MERFVGYFKLPFYHTVEGRPLVFLLNGHNDNRTVDGIAALQAATQKELGVRKLHELNRTLLPAWTASLSVGCLAARIDALIPSVDITEPYVYVVWTGCYIVYMGPSE